VTSFVDIRGRCLRGLRVGVEHPARKERRERRGRHQAHPRDAFHAWQRHL